MSVDLLRQLIVELLSTPQFTTPDANAGHGYGRLGKPSGPGMHRMAGAEFPYTSTRADEDDVDPDEDETSQDTRTKIGNATLSNVRWVDNTRMGDKFSYCSGNVKINEDGADALPRLITLRPRSGRNVGGSQYGWSHAPPPFVDDVDDEEVFDIEDLVQYVEDRPLERAGRRAFQRHKNVYDR